MPGPRKINPKNQQSTLFKKLTRLLSGPIVNYRTQTARRLRRRQLDKYANKFISASGKQFKRIDYNPFAGLHAGAQGNQNRLERYVDFLYFLILKIIKDSIQEKFIYSEFANIFYIIVIYSTIQY